MEKAANPAAEASSTGTQEKPSISRSYSLTKIFTPRVRRTSSLPVTPVVHSNPDFAHSGSIGGPQNSTVSFHDQCLKNV